MKDTILTARRKKTELITLFLCFIIANLVNLYSEVTKRVYFIGNERMLIDHDSNRLRFS